MSDLIIGIVAWIIILLLIFGIAYWGYSWYGDETYKNLGGNMMFWGIVSTAVFVKLRSVDEK